jgi:hypothetical protein
MSFTEPNYENAILELFRDELEYETVIFDIQSGMVNE